MVRLLVGVGQVTLLLRHAQSLKEKRHVAQGLSQRLKNRGFTVTECGYRDEPKKLVLGFSYVADEVHEVEKAFDQVLPFFLGDYDIVEKKREIVDFFDEESIDLDEALQNDPREPY